MEHLIIALLLFVVGPALGVWAFAEFSTEKLTVDDMPSVVGLAIIFWPGALPMGVLHFIARHLSPSFVKGDSWD